MRRVWAGHAAARLGRLPADSFAAVNQALADGRDGDHPRRGWSAARDAGLGGSAVWWFASLELPPRLDTSVTRRRTRRATRVARLPGRLGPLVQKEHRSILRMPTLWRASCPCSRRRRCHTLLLGLINFRLLRSRVVCALNLNLTSNCLGLDRPAALTRYLISDPWPRPLPGQETPALAGALVSLLAPLIAIGAWKGGVAELGAELLVPSCRCWTLRVGNIVSVFEPRRAEPRRFVQGTDSSRCWSARLWAAPRGWSCSSRFDPFSIGGRNAGGDRTAHDGLVQRSLRYAGSAFERRVEIISRRLAWTSGVPCILSSPGVAFTTATTPLQNAAVSTEVVAILSAGATPYPA